MAVGSTTVWPWQQPRAVVPTGGGGPAVFLCAAFWCLGASPWAAGFAFLGAFLGIFCYAL